MPGLRGRSGPVGAGTTLAVVSLALFALLSMHGWGSHDGAHQPGSAVIDAVSATQHSADHPSPMDAESDGPGGALLMELCLAVLAGPMLGIALLFARRGGRMPRTVLTGWPPPLSAPRLRSRPGWSLHCEVRCCVIRC